MEPNGKDNLKAPLLQTSENVSVTSPGGSKKDENKTKQVKFRIRGINCGSCAVSIESVVANMKGVESISVSPLQGQAEVFYKPELTNVSKVIKLGVVYEFFLYKLVISFYLIIIIIRRFE